jgi:ribosome biogenesis protein NSA1
VRYLLFLNGPCYDAHCSEAFVGDQGCNLLALDLRTGHTIYSYKGLSGAITSLAVTPCGHLASTSNDHFFRLHSTHPPPEMVGAQQEKKGAVLCQAYNMVAMNAVVWDGIPEETVHAIVSDDEEAKEEDEGDVWEGMQGVSDDDDESVRRPKPAKRKK